MRSVVSRGRRALVVLCGLALVAAGAVPVSAAASASTPPSEAPVSAGSYPGARPAPVGAAAAAVVDRPVAAPASCVGCVELPGLRTASSRTFAVPGGAREAVFYGHPVNHRDREGVWRTTDTTFEEVDGGFATKRSPVRTVVPGSLAAGAVRVERDRQWVEFSPVAASGSARVEANTVTYAGAWPSVDVVYTALPDRLKEDVVLRSAQAATSFRFEVAVSSGLRVRDDGAGLAVVDEAGATAFVFGAPFMFDAAGVRSDGVGLEAAATAGGGR